ncbi:MAG: ferritin-like domain-containing protein [Alphaproteobacteria bacterium]
MTVTLSDRAVGCLRAQQPAEKVALTRAAAAWWRVRPDRPLGRAEPPDRPGRPARPPLVAPGGVPRRRVTSGVPGRVALLHALAHIELNAIDLAWDMVARFGPGQPRAFCDDWVTVAAEEALHFALIADRLGALGAAYGDLPAHDGLWEAAQATADDLAGRLAVVPLVLEARGLDVTPAMIARLQAVGDETSAAVLQRIYDDEIGHVAVGKRWFDTLCRQDGHEPQARWQALVRARFRGQLKPPFNEAARSRAGLPAAWYAGDSAAIA